jgi:PleD family two-component response regulator
MLAPEISYPRPPLALILTDQEWVSLSMVTLFAPRGYAVLRAFSGQQAVQRMREAPVDLLMVDRDLKDMSAVDLCRSMRLQNAATPLLMLSTSPWNRDEKLAALRAGAWEVCSLPMDSEELFVRVDTWVRSKLAGDVAREQGLLDPETGLYNAQGLLRRIAELGAGADRHRRPLACLVLAADPAPAAAPASQTWTTATAASLASTLRESGRASDTIGRLSPTEFVVVAPDTDSEGVLGLAGRLHKRVQAVLGPDARGGRVRLGCYAVPDFHDASIAPTELLIRAAEASRTAHADDEPIHFFESAFTPTN